MYDNISHLTAKIKEETPCAICGSGLPCSQSEGMSGKIEEKFENGQQPIARRKEGQLISKR